jgi:hypothetical protein
VAWHFSSSLYLEQFSLPPWRIALELEHILTDEQQTSGEEKLWGRGMRGVTSCKEPKDSQSREAIVHPQ